MIVIRLSKFGRLNTPFYRIVVADKRSKREGKPVEILGTWNPTKKELKLDSQKLKDWQKKGAKLSAGLNKLVT